MSSSNDSTTSVRDEVSPTQRDALGMIRRMAVTLTSGPFWQAVGHLLLDGSRETRQFEPFSGVGFYARPKAGRNVEVILTFVGGAQNPVGIAARDEETRKKMANIAEDESAMYNTVVRFLLRSNGTAEIALAGGTPHQLALKSDVANLANHVDTLLVGGSGSAATPGAAPQPTGTTVFKAQ